MVNLRRWVGLAEPDDLIAKDLFYLGPLLLSHSTNCICTPEAIKAPMGGITAPLHMKQRAKTFSGLCPLKELEPPCELCRFHPIESSFSNPKLGVPGPVRYLYLLWQPRMRVKSDAPFYLEGYPKPDRISEKLWLAE